jgi:hypothetical protein
VAKTLVNASLYFDGADLPSYTNEVDVNLSADVRDFTNFASLGWKEFKSGLLSAEMMTAGFWDGPEPDATLFANLGGTGKPFTAVETYPPAHGSLAYFVNALASKYNIGNKVGEPANFSLNLASTAPVVRGRVLDPRLGASAATASGNGTAFQLGAVLSTQRLYYAVHVVRVSGTSPTLDLVLESDNAGGFGSAATVATLAQFTSLNVPGSIYGVVDGPITDDYFRVARTIGGSSTPTFEYLFVVAIGPKP